MLAQHTVTLDLNTLTSCNEGSSHTQIRLFMSALGTPQFTPEMLAKNFLQQTHRICFISSTLLGQKVALSGQKYVDAQA